MRSEPLQSNQICCAVLLVLALAATVPTLGAEPRDRYDCQFATSAIKIDGKLDDAAWNLSEPISDFRTPWLKGRPLATATTTAYLLWDREHFYFAAQLQDKDLFAATKEHDGETWHDDVFEIFFKPADDKPGYYEFQVNAAGTVLDMFLPRRNAGGYRRFARDGDFHIESSVTLQGTLNQWRDVDEGWTVEGRIPWSDFAPTGGRPQPDEAWKFTLCRYDYTVDREGPELSTIAPFGEHAADFHRFEEYASLKFIGPKTPGGDNAAKLDRLEALKTAITEVESRVQGSPDPPLPMKVVRARPELKLTFPIFVTSVPGSDQLLLIDQKWSYGPARVATTTSEPGQLTTFIELPSEGVAYSLAFDPKFTENGYLYLGWNGSLNGGKKRSYITRYTLDSQKPFRLKADSALHIIDWESDGHNGAAVAFGLDGLLYVTSGDGTSDSDMNLAGQRLDHLLGKVLRIDVRNATAELPYTVPADNPFSKNKAARPETWAYGLRNPWRLTVDPKSGDVWVGNNGQDLWEQVYLIQRGANYGWSAFEGSHPFYPDRAANPNSIISPTLEHHHSVARSLTGGVVYHGQKWPQLQGHFVYGDYSTGKIWAAKAIGGKVIEHREIADTTLQISCFALDQQGELWIIDHRGNGEGGLYTLAENAPAVKRESFPQKLSETGLFTDVRQHQVHPGLLPYSVNSPLWSDGAYKERFLYLPTQRNDAGKKVPARFTIDEGDLGWNLPEGTIAVKSFALETKRGDPASKRWIETRLLVKEQNEWQGYSYRWNSDQTDANLVLREGEDATFVIHDQSQDREQKWHFPSRTECMVCHSRAANFALGLSTPQMNKMHSYGDTQANQLEVLEWLGVLQFSPSDPHVALRELLSKAGKSEPEIERQLQLASTERSQRTSPVTTLLSKPPARMVKLVDPDDPAQELTARVRSYLHANCAQCHVEAGGGNAQMQLSWTTPLEKMKLIDVPPLHHRFGLTEPKLVASGAPERSVLLHRLALRGPGQMPQFATNVVDEQAVKLFTQWIESLPSNTAGK